MEISFLGMNCIRLSGKSINVLCDPYAKAAGMPEMNIAQDATLITQETTDVTPKPGMIIEGPGEYEIGGSLITGVAAGLHVDDPAAAGGAQGTIYTAEIDDVRVVHLGNIAPTVTNEQIEAMGRVDILTIPVGGHGLTLDAQAAAAIVSQLEPKYVIPTHYDDGKTIFEMPQDKLDLFLKEIGSNPEPVSKLKVTTKDLPLETTVVVLERSGG